MAEAREAQQQQQHGLPRPTARHENLHESLLADELANMPRRSRAPRTAPAPRVVPPAPAIYRPPFLLAVLFAPFRASYRVMAGVLRSIFYLLSLLPAPLRPRLLTTSMRKGLGNASERRALKPSDSAERFRREFEEEYGAHGLPLFQGGHAQALDAAKRDLKFLLTVVLSPEHDDTDGFVRNTLLAPEVVAFLNDPANNVLVWAGNVLDSEAWQVAREYMVTKYPFSCVICLTPKEGSTRMGTVKRLTGPMTAQSYLAGIQSAINKYAPDLNGVRAEREAQAVVRNLRDEQDSAYERSLARDRERARQKREAEAAAREAERKAREDEEAAERQAALRAQWRRWRATTVRPEPEAGAKGAVRLALVLPASWQLEVPRVVRRFDGETTVEELYAFVECYDILHGHEEGQGEDGDKAAEKPDGYEHEYKFQIASVMPRETLEVSETVTIADKMGRGGNLVVEDVILDDDSDNEENVSS